MAPRLSHWILLTALASIVVGVMFLSTGGTPLGLMGVTWSDGDDRDLTPLARRIEGTGSALSRTRHRIEALEFEARFQVLLARNAGDPLVVRQDGAALVVDPAATAAVSRIWAGLPTRRADIRTAVILNGPAGAFLGGVAGLEAGGVCVARVPDPERGGGEALIRELRASAGLCLFAEQFGPPGEGFVRWDRGGIYGLSWDRAPRIYAWRYRDDGETERLPAWFEGGMARLSSVRFGRSAQGQEELACLADRVAHCGVASGVTAAGWPATNGRDWSRFPHATMMSDLYRDLGPAKFAMIWQGDAPIAESYAQATGTSIDPWLNRRVHARLGFFERDNALSLPGWIGALLWLALFGILTRERLKQRVVT